MTALLFTVTTITLLVLAGYAVELLLATYDQEMIDRQRALAKLDSYGE